MNDINSRIALLRQNLNLSMEKFGYKIGITRSSVNSIEKGVNNPSDQTIKLICREFNVNPYWLKDGKGEMFNNVPETLLDELVDEYNLDELQKNIVKTYLELDEQDKNVITNFLLKALKK